MEFTGVTNAHGPIPANSMQVPNMQSYDRNVSALIPATVKNLKPWALNELDNG